MAQVRRTLNVALRPALLLLALLLAGCSGLGLAYNRLDWLIPWYLGDYVTFDKTQQRQLDTALAALLDWHRREQLPRYADLLDALADDLRDGLDAASLQRHETALRGFWHALLTRTRSDLVALAGSLTPAQIDGLLMRLETENNRKFRDNYLRGPRRQRIDRRLERAETGLERWIGRLGNAQRLALRRWSGQFIDAAEAQLAYRERWQTALRTALRDSDPAALDAILYALLTEPQTLPALAPYADARERRRQRFRQLLLELDGLLTSAQRDRALTKLSGYSDELRALARER